MIFSFGEPASAFAPVFAPRYLAGGAPAFLVLAAVGAAYCARKVARQALVASGALVLATDLGANLAAYYAAEPKPRWDLAATALAEWLHEDDAVLFHDGFTRWLVHSHLVRARRSVPPDLVVDAPEGLAYARATRRIARVWVPYGRVGFGAAQADTRALIEASLPRLRELLASQGFNLMDASVSSGFSGSQGGHSSSGASGTNEPSAARAASAGRSPAAMNSRHTA